MHTDGPTVAADNPLLQPWTGPFGGVPPFDRVRVADFEPAFEAAMADQLAAIDRITAQADPPTFDNTTVALERAGRVLDRVRAIYEVFCGGLNDAAMQAVERRMAPRLAAFADRIVANEKLFARVAAVYEARERSGLTPEQRRLAWLHHTDLVLAGARLDAAAKRDLAAINEELAALQTAFSQNVLADETDAAVFIADEAGLAGLPASARDAAAAAAGPCRTRDRASSRFSPMPSGATCASGCGGCSSAAAMAAPRPTTSRRSRGFSSCGRDGRSSSGLRRTPTGGWRTRWPSRPSVPSR
jgi:Zn-dependent oligopeptidase